MCKRNSENHYLGLDNGAMQLYANIIAALLCRNWFVYLKQPDLVASGDVYCRKGKERSKRCGDFICFCDMLCFSSPDRFLVYQR